MLSILITPKPIWRFYVEARKKFKKLSLTAGLRFEDYKVDRLAIQDGTETEVDFTNSNFFPNASAMYEFNENMNLSASFSKKIFKRTTMY